MILTPLTGHHDVAGWGEALVAPARTAGAAVPPDRNPGTPKQGVTVTSFKCSLPLLSSVTKTSSAEHPGGSRNVTLNCPTRIPGGRPMAPTTWPEPRRA